MKRFLLLIALSLSATVSLADNIPKKLRYITLPYAPEIANFEVFTDINARGYAVGYGRKDGRYIGFIFNYHTEQVELTLDGFWPARINDSNKIVGIDVTSPNLPAQTCIYNNNVCELAALEGAEYTLPNWINGMTNSNIITGLFQVNTDSQQQMIFRGDRLIHSDLVDGDLSKPDFSIMGVQKNNTRLMVGRERISEVDAYPPVYRPIVKVMNSDQSITTLQLPIPNDVTDTDNVLASGVNSRNEIIIHAQYGLSNTAIYLCQYLGDQDGDNIAECKDGLQLISQGGYIKAVSSTPSFLNAITPINDQGIMLAPPLSDGQNLRYYDLTQQPPVVKSFAEYDGNIDIFRNVIPLDIENNGAVLVQAAQTVIFVPDDPVDIVVDSTNNVEPVIFGSDGGRLQFTDRIENHTTNALNLYTWHILLEPDGIPVSIGKTRALTLEVGEIFEDTRSRLSLRPTDSSGEYRYVFYVRNRDTGELYSDEIRITKQP